MHIAIGSDHGGYKLKEDIKKYFSEKKYIYKDFGCNSEESCDYPDFGFPAAESVSKEEFERGILICKSGIGMSIVANKVKGVRAALCHNADVARKSREHNNSNILILSADATDINAAKDIINVWLETDFTEGRHIRRIDKINQYEKGK
jgi:ribose 5-phosphate isomerase B